MLRAASTLVCKGKIPFLSCSAMRCASTIASKVETITVDHLLAARAKQDIPHKSGGALRMVAPKTPVVEAIRSMYEGGTAGTVLISDGNHVIGSVNEKDYVSSLTHGSFPPTDVTVEQIMFTDFQAATRQTPLVSVLKAMLARGRRHMPVLKDSAVPSLSNAVLPALLSPSDVTHIISVRDVVGMLSTDVFDMQEHDESEPKPVEPGLSWDSKVESMLADMQARGSKILLNTRLDDNISVADAANVMADKNMSCVAVVDDAGLLVGLFTARDFLQRVVLPGHDASKLRVRDIMTREPYTASLDRTMLRCARSMIKRNIRHLPIVDHNNGNKVAGLVSMADVARAFVMPFGGATDSSKSAVKPSGSSVLTAIVK